MGRHIVDGVQPSVFLRLDGLWTVDAEKALEKHGMKPRCVGQNVLTTRLHIGQNVLQSRAKIGQNVINLNGRGYRESPGNVGHSERRERSKSLLADRFWPPPGGSSWSCGVGVSRHRVVIKYNSHKNEIK